MSDLADIIHTLALGVLAPFLAVLGVIEIVLKALVIILFRVLGEDL
jgi:hypothetical protein